MSTPPTFEKATLAGGCFWCMEPPFEKLEGVADVVAGYTGGKKPNPTYDEVCSGATGHVEAIQITYDPVRISYDELLSVFWQQIDPTDETGQFADQGSQYRTAIFYHNPEQRKISEESKARLEKEGIFDKPITVNILPADTFYPAEDYHQDYYKTNTARYKAYRAGSGRDQYRKKNLKTKLTPLQYHITQECGTEPPFQNEYWNNKAKGIYVDRVSGEPLFSSKDKFDSGTGWPSFTCPLKKEMIVEKEDVSHGRQRIEVRSRSGDSHLGHVFEDGPHPTGRRFCINSASLRFISKEDLEKEGYGEFRKLFE